MELLQHLSTLIPSTHVVILLVIAVRVIMKRPATGVALAWLLLVAAVPFLGATVYLLIGERRIGNERSRRIMALRVDFGKIAEAAVRKGLMEVDWSRHSAVAYGMDQLGQKMMRSPTVCGSSLQMHSVTSEILTAIAADIEAAENNVLMEFYIWSQGGQADEVLDAVVRAAQRGVTCRLLIDALGARPWWMSDQPQRLRAAGVQLQAALPVGLFRTFVGRTDLRLHRKIVVIDGSVAWTGSMNLVDPRFFKQDSGVGEWVDAMVRCTGAVVAPLAATMIGDWLLETGESLDELVVNTGLQLLEPDGSADIQVIPSGPGTSDDGLLLMLLGLINSARQELVLTTPYLVPDESLLRAIRGAAARGVAVSLILPEKVDSLLTRYASRSYYGELLELGVKIHLYRDGLLHTKSITVDRQLAMFGTVNLDMRSLWLNYEVALFVYDESFSGVLRELQQSYMDRSVLIDPVVWKSRLFRERFLENTLRLVGPIL